LHIEAYHSQINNRKKKTCSTLIFQKRNLQKQERKTEKKISYFIKGKQNGNVNTSSPRHTHAKTLKAQKTRHNKTEQKMNENKHIPN
jgi:hypothetical protein